KKTIIDNYHVHEDTKCAPGLYIGISISDTGVGIPEELKSKIFDPFYTTKDKSIGTGLGLTMVQHIVNQHKGFMELYTEQGRGTNITVYLPASPEKEGKPIETPGKRILVSGKGKILIIDDEEIIRTLLKSILSECGYEVITAENGNKGIEILKGQRPPPDLIILDMSMPGLSGKETFIGLKQINPQQKILLCSGFFKDDRIQDLMNMGLEEFIQKPFDYIELSEKILRIIQSQ
ncbi:MAG: response regulator, partial [Spirochaetaceae bacterium]|nr:response regulator [Spirochaetaceae bacterium]